VTARFKYALAHRLASFMLHKFCAVFISLFICLTGCGYAIQFATDINAAPNILWTSENLPQIGKSRGGPINNADYTFRTRGINRHSATTGNAGAVAGEPGERGHRFDGKVNKFNPVYQFLDKLYKLDSGGAFVGLHPRRALVWRAAHAKGGEFPHRLQSR